MKVVETYWAKIFVGLRPGYEDVNSCILRANRQYVEDICQSYCNEVGLCVTITDTKFIYKNGNEPGVIVGLINYPRFPEEYGVKFEDTKIRKQSKIIAEKLMVRLKQNRVSIMYPDETVMLENDAL